MPNEQFKNNNDHIDYDELIINYHDAVIYGSDLHRFERRTEWLNDSCIHFFFAVLAQQQQQQSMSSNHEDFVRSTKFPGRTGNSCNGNGNDDTSSNSNANGNDGGLIFVAVNDTMSTTAGDGDDSWKTPNSGNHWSLLVMEVTNATTNTKTAPSSSSRLSFWHFDSIRNSGNIRAAEDIARKMRVHVYPNAEIVTERKTKATATGTKTMLVRAAETPQQRNGYDCGVHVLGSARIISNNYYHSCSSASTATTDAAAAAAKKARTLTTARRSSRLEQLEDCLRKGIGRENTNAPQPELFCAELRAEISSEIRKLYDGKKKGKERK
eukprot:CAMPEP_0168284218 /NCGR_PEP_ID=MMETSP0141_2-20121125/23385_1 /TAXON_ID=44445 /ORGANISM="Pseudo-nitzschia australis, Strain 10249 10 AB" /LENGTH=323 /DNA_ID=CAMNT_0008228199 /DNA_START=29 /DNA_END=1001 /DNA_ORIENTATION=+